MVLNSGFRSSKRNHAAFPGGGRGDLPKRLAFPIGGKVEIVLFHNGFRVAAFQRGLAYGLERGNVHGKKRVAQNIMPKGKLGADMFRHAVVIGGQDVAGEGVQPCC